MQESKRAEFKSLFDEFIVTYPLSRVLADEVTDTVVTRRKDAHSVTA